MSLVLKQEQVLYDSVIPDFSTIEKQKKVFEKIVYFKGLVNYITKDGEEKYILNEGHRFSKGLEYLTNQEKEFSPFSKQKKEVFSIIYALIMFGGYIGWNKFDGKSNSPRISIRNKSMQHIILNLLKEHNIYHDYEMRPEIGQIALGKNYSHFLKMMENNFKKLKENPESKYFEKESLIECILDNEFDKKSSKKAKKLVISSLLSIHQNNIGLNFLTKNQPNENNKHLPNYKKLIENWLENISGCNFSINYVNSVMDVKKEVDLIYLTNPHSGFIMPKKHYQGSLDIINIEAHFHEKALELKQTISKYEFLFNTVNNYFKTEGKNISFKNFLEESNKENIKISKTLFYRIIKKKVGKKIVKKAIRMNELGLYQTLWKEGNSKLQELWEKPIPIKLRKMRKKTISS